MHGKNPLDRLTDLARQSRNKAGQRLAGARDGHRQVTSQYETLKKYRSDYARQLAAAMEAGIDLATLSDYQNFLNSLDGAIARAQESLTQQRDRVDQCRRDWENEHRRLVSFDSLASRRAAESRRRLERIENQQQDEIANNLYLRAQRARASDS